MLEVGMLTQAIGGFRRPSKSCRYRSSRTVRLSAWYFIFGPWGLEWQKNSGL